MFPAQSHPVLMILGWAPPPPPNTTHQCSCKCFLLPSIILLFSSIFDCFSSETDLIKLLINSQNTRFLAQMTVAHVVCIMHELSPLLTHTHTHTHTQTVCDIVPGFSVIHQTVLSLKMLALHQLSSLADITVSRKDITVTLQFKVQGFFIRHIIHYTGYNQK